MQLTHPASLLWLLLALPLVAFFLLKVRPRRQTVSTLLFWQDVIPDSRARRWWQRLRDPLMLACQLLLLGLLAAALAEPVWPTGQRQRAWCVVLDNSASMQATDVDPDRLSVARQQIQRMIDDLGPNDQLALITAGTSAELQCGWSSRRSALRQSLAEITATDGPSRLADAIELARRLNPPPNSQRVLTVVTDPGGRRDSDQLDSSTLAPFDDVSWIVCGQLADNRAITQFQVRRALLDPLGFECLIELNNLSAQSSGGQLKLQLDQQLLDVVPLDLQPGESRMLTLAHTTPSGGVLTVELDLPDVLQIDNRAVAVLAPRPVRRVTLVTSGNWYLEKVLAALPLVELETVAAPPPASDASRILVIDQQPPHELPAGRAMLIQPTNDHALWQVGPSIADAVLARTTGQSPLTAHLQLEDLPVPGARQLQFRATARVLAATSAGVPVLAIVHHAQGELLILNVNLGEGDFAWRTAFPLLMANAVNWLAGQSADFRAAFAAGDVVDLADEIALSQTARPMVQSPRGRWQRVSFDGNRAALGPLDQTGIWRVASGAPSATDANVDKSKSIRLACNLANRQESDLRTGRVEPLPTLATARVAKPAWYYLVALALALIATEWWLYQRRWIG